MGWALTVSGIVPSLIFGVAFGNLFLGVPFRYDDSLRMTYEGGLIGLLRPFALLVRRRVAVHAADARRRLWAA